VTVHPLRVTGAVPVWKEQAERHMQWMSLEDASMIVDEPGLAALLRRIDGGD
jgi:hypothetical protein